MTANAAQHSEQRTPQWRSLLQATLIVLAAFVAGQPALRGGWLWDDEGELAQNPEITGSSGLRHIWFAPSQQDYLPLKSTVQWIAWRVWGENPVAFHGLNLALHALSGLLVWRLFRRLQIPSPWLGGILFSLHPVTVESVAWIAELKNTLSLPPLLLAMCAYVEFAEGGRRSRYFAALGWFVASLLCKGSGVMLPCVLLLFHFWRDGKIAGPAWRRLLPFFVTSLVAGLVTIYFQHTRAIGAVPIPVTGISSRLAVAGLALVFYAWKILVPVGLVPVYPKWELTAPFALQWVPWLGILAITAVAWQARRTWGRHVLFGCGGFALLVAPVLGFVAMSYQRYSWVADHFVYLPMLGLIGLVTGLLGRALANANGAMRRLAPLAVGLLCVALLLLSRRHSAVFQNETIFWRFVLGENPAFWVGHNSLGNALQRAGHSAAAKAHLEAAIAGDPTYAVPHNNLGVLHRADGRAQEALGEFQTAVRLDPTFAAARSNLANALLAAGQTSAAIAEYREALRLEPQLVEARSNFANALFLTGHAPEAIAELKRVLSDRPGYATAHNNLGGIFVRMGRADEAVPPYREAVRLVPDNATFHRDLGYALILTGDAAAARTCFESALRLRPDDVDAHTNLAGLLYQQGDVAGAVSHYEMALRLDPAAVEPRKNLELIRQSTPPKSAVP